MCRIKKIRLFVKKLWSLLKRFNCVRYRIKRCVFNVQGKWSLHSYYTLSPFAPDGSGRILIAGANLESMTGAVLVISDKGKVLKNLNSQPISESFWHTGFWQSWSNCSRYVYYQSGTLSDPVSIRHNLTTGHTVQLKGDLEGMCPSGEPGYSSYHGMLYAAGYGDGKWKPEASPVPFQSRDKHGIFLMNFNKLENKLILSVAQLLDVHPQKNRLLLEEEKIKKRLGPSEGLTLMCYCVRWNPQGTRLLFYFGNHCVDKSRYEPRIAYVFTADKNLNNLKLALDLSFQSEGVHWGWQPCGEKLIGYGPRPDGKGIQLAEVCHDGTGYTKLSDHSSGGHPIVSPTNPDLIVTDEGVPKHGNIVFISRATGMVIHREPMPKFLGESEPEGRNPNRVCHHPVFSADGKTILCNTLTRKHAAVALLKLPKSMRKLRFYH
jgi:hypothetical protein